MRRPLPLRRSLVVLVAAVVALAACTGSAPDADEGEYDLDLRGVTVRR